MNEPDAIDKSEDDNGWREIAHASPGHFALCASGHRLKYSQFWREIDAALLRVALGEIRNLIINIPPQWGKSELVSRHFPAWYLGSYPAKKIILVSYESDYAASWGMRARELYKEYAPGLWGHRLGMMATSDWWETDAGGYMATAGALSSITGKGAHVLIIDDPHKNSSEAHSKVTRDKIWDNYRSTFLTRLQPDGAQIIIQTRWHEDDLTGRILRQEGDRWTRIIKRALDDNNESIYPERFTTAELLQRRTTMGSYIFDALYQQSPRPKDGGMFKAGWAQLYDVHPGQFSRIIQTWDLTFGDTGESFCVGILLGKCGSNAFVLDGIRKKLTFPEQVREIRAMRERHPYTQEILIERKANGEAAIKTLEDEIPGIVGVNPTESKEARASAITFIVEAGNLHFRRGDDFTNQAIDEMLSFPNGETDDVVDALSQGLYRLYLHDAGSAGLGGI